MRVINLLLAHLVSLIITVGVITPLVGLGIALKYSAIFLLITALKVSQFTYWLRGLPFPEHMRLVRYFPNSKR